MAFSTLKYVTELRGDDINEFKDSNFNDFYGA